MLMPRWLTLLVLGGLALLLPAEALLAQGKQPPFPPGLHDRTLPPGRPLDGGGLDPAGGSPNQTLEDDAAAELQRYLNDAAFGQSHRLADAVTAFNRWVVQLSEGQLRNPPQGFLRAYTLLTQHLGMDNAEPPGSARVVRRGGGFASLASLEDPVPYDLDQEVSQLRSTYLLPEPETGWGRRSDWMFPGMAAATPTGFGAEMGMVWAGASYQPKVRYNDGDDGAVAVGFGLGDARRLVGIQVGINSFSTVNSGWGNRVGVDVHVHKSFGDLLGVAVGWESVRGGYQVTRDSGENVYVVGSRWLKLRSNPYESLGMAMISFGVGTGRFQLEEDFYAERGGVGVFGSFGIRVAPPLSLIAEWTGQDLMLATSVTPLRTQRVAITAGFTEVTGAAGDGARFVIGGSVGYDFKNR